MFNKGVDMLRCHWRKCTSVKDHPFTPIYPKPVGVSASSIALTYGCCQVGWVMGERAVRDCIGGVIEGHLVAESEAVDHMHHARQHSNSWGKNGANFGNNILSQAPQNYNPRAKSGPRNHFIWPQRHFCQQWKVMCLQKNYWLMEYDTSRNNRIT